VIAAADRARRQVRGREPFVCRHTTHALPTILALWASEAATAGASCPWPLYRRGGVRGVGVCGARAASAASAVDRAEATSCAAVGCVSCRLLLARGDRRRAGSRRPHVLDEASMAWI
jgi:hypothetical protein